MLNLNIKNSSLNSALTCRRHVNLFVICKTNSKHIEALGIYVSLNLTFGEFSLSLGSLYLRFFAAIFAVCLLNMSTRFRAFTFRLLIWKLIANKRAATVYSSSGSVMASLHWSPFCHWCQHMLCEYSIWILSLLLLPLLLLLFFAYSYKQRNQCLSKHLCYFKVYAHTRRQEHK